MAINSVTIVGNLTKDVELKGLPSGSQVAQMRIAVNERRKDQSGQWVDSPNFFNVTTFGAQAENAAKYLAKGRQVAVTGRLRWREWEDKNTGTKREFIEIVAQDVQFIGGRDQNTSQQNQQAMPSQQYQQQQPTVAAGNIQQYQQQPLVDDFAQQVQQPPAIPSAYSDDDIPF